MKSTESQKAAIRKVYAEFFQTADQIVIEPELSNQFLQQVNALLPENEHMTQPSVNSALLSLRKKGEEKGGLPRKQRAFNGRVVN